MKPVPPLPLSAVGGLPLRSRLPLWRRAVRLLGRQLFRLAENNDDARQDRNGEEWLLRELLQRHAHSGEKRPFVVFDVGGNVGDYTRAVLRLARATGCPVAVHVFEPSPHCVATLQAAFAGEAAVRLTAAAAGPAAGEARLHGELGSGHASLLPRDVLRDAPAPAITVPVIALGDYLRAQGVGHIDLLKLDIEGSELGALRGLGDRLDPAIIRMIQFEYGGANLDGRSTLRDFYDLLGARGYRMAKLFPAALEVRRYAPWMEHYAYANYVAVAVPGEP